MIAMGRQLSSWLSARCDLGRGGVQGLVGLFSVFIRFLKSRPIAAPMNGTIIKMTENRFIPHARADGNPTAMAMKSYRISEQVVVSSAMRNVVASAVNMNGTDSPRAQG